MALRVQWYSIESKDIVKENFYLEIVFNHVERFSEELHE